MGFGLTVVTVGLGLAWLLIFRFAIHALPLFAGYASGVWAYKTGAGLIGGIAVGVAAACTTLWAGKAALRASRTRLTRAVVTLIFVAPAVYAGYNIVFSVAEYTVPSGVWRHLLAGAVALVVGTATIGWLRPKALSFDTASAWYPLAVRRSSLE
jgi:hypothetical protein